MTLIDPQGRLFGRASLIDTLAVLFSLSLIPLPYYAFRNVVDNQELSIESITPKVIVAGGSDPLTIMGSGFGLEAAAQIDHDGPFQKCSFVNNASVEIPVPSDIKAGTHDLFLKNNNGRLVAVKDAFWVIWKPQISKVDPAKIDATSPVELAILGKYFQKDCTVTFGQMAIERMKYVNPTYLGIFLKPSSKIPWGKYDIRVRNPNGYEALMPNAVEVTGRTLVRVLVGVSFDNLKPRQLRALASISEGQCLLRRDFNVTHISTSVMLTSEAEPAGNDLLFFYRGGPLTVGSQVKLAILGLSLEGRVIKKPASVIFVDD